MTLQGMPSRTSPLPGGTPAVLAAALVVLGGCVGPRDGIFGHMRGRTEIIAEAEERPPPPLEAAATDGGVHAFPLFFHEDLRERRTRAVIWPFFEAGRSSESDYLRVRPFYYHDRFRGAERLVVFPFYFRLREGTGPGEHPRSIDHFWPFYGVHRERIDLVPTTTRHVLFPIFYFREGEGKWKVRLWPAAWVSSGFLDRGWWIIPVLKTGVGKGGWAGGNRYFYLLDPLIQLERFSIAEPGHEEGPLDSRLSFRLLGGLLGYERAEGKSWVRFFWLKI